MNDIAQDQNAIKALIEQYIKSLMDKDWDTFEQTLHPDFRYFTDGCFKLEKWGFIDFLKKDDWKGSAYQLSDIEIKLKPNHTVVFATYCLQFEGISKSKELSFHAIETTIFQKEKNWKIIHTHTSNKMD